MATTCQLVRPTSRHPAQLVALAPATEAAVRWAQGLEKYLMTKLYSKVFAVSQTDQERDEALARRMEVRGHAFQFSLIETPGQRPSACWFDSRQPCCH